MINPFYLYNPQLIFARRRRLSQLNQTGHLQGLITIHEVHFDRSVFSDNPVRLIDKALYPPPVKLFKIEVKPRPVRINLVPRNQAILSVEDRTEKMSRGVHPDQPISSLPIH